MWRDAVQTATLSQSPTDHGAASAMLEIASRVTSSAAGAFQPASRIPQLSDFKSTWGRPGLRQLC